MQKRRRFGWLVAWVAAIVLAAVAPSTPRGVALGPEAAARKVPAHGAGADGPVRAEGSARVTAKMARLPLRFEANTGQWDERVRFVTRQGGLTLFLTDDGMTFGLSDVKRPALKPGSSPDEEREARERALREAKHAAVSMKLVGSKPTPPRGDKDLVTKSNFFFGNDPSKWRTNVPNFAEVRAKGWLPGVDVVWHGRAGGLEYDLEVEAGVDAQSIELAVDGAESLAVAEDGALQIATAAGTLVQKPPRVVQDGRDLTARYVVSAPGRVRFDIDGYDARVAVLVDPVLAYSTYLGGSLAEYAYDVAVDASGSAYVVGGLGWTEFPTANPVQPTYNAASVAKLNAEGSALVYSTYLGGGSPASVAVDGSGNAYVVGTTRSNNFPTANALQPYYGGCPTTDRGGDAFLAKLNAAGSALVYSTFLGGSSCEVGRGVAVDGDGNAYVVGDTNSTDFPTANALRPTYSGNRAVDWVNLSPVIGDAFVTKLNAAGSAFVYSTFLGGAFMDSASGVAVDGSGNAYVVGETASQDFPTANALQPTCRGMDAFIAKLNAIGSAFVYSTFLGGASLDSANGVAVDATGNAYVVGYTLSQDFPTANALQPTYGGGGVAWGDAFVAKLNAAGSARVYATYLGGAAGDRASGVAVDADGNAYVVGTTDSLDFPTTNAMQPPNGAGQDDAFVAKLDAAGSALLYSTFLGGTNSDQADSVAVDATGNAYVVGRTRSQDFPTVNAMQPTYGGGWNDAFVAKLSSNGVGAACTSGAQCDSGFCADGVCCESACNGQSCYRCDLPASLGTCSLAPAGDPGSNPSCSPFACDGAGACATSCVADDQCAPTHYCAKNKQCEPRKAQGQACDLKKDCKSSPCRACDSGFCADGVCCDAACDGTCQACTASLKQSGADTGTCGPIKDGTDPRDECATSSGVCGADGMCNGAGACHLPSPAGVSCGASTCQGTIAQGDLCDGAGACTTNTTGIDCAPFLCNAGGGCTTTCATNDNCATGAFCSGTVCENQRADGKTCASDDQCLSLHCTDGICCNAACAGQCEACDVPGSEGTCAPVTGAPRGARSSCAAAGAGGECTARACDGVARTTCEGFAGAETACGAPSCSGGVATSAGSCNGLGACQPPAPVQCSPYACGATACNTACTTDAECAAAAHCNPPTSTCVFDAPPSDAGTPSNDPGTPSNDPGTPSDDPGTPSNDPGTPSNDPGGTAAADEYLVAGGGGCGCVVGAPSPTSGSTAWPIALLSALAATHARRRRRAAHASPHTTSR